MVKANLDKIEKFIIKYKWAPTDLEPREWTVNEEYKYYLGSVKNVSGINQGCKGVSFMSGDNKTVWIGRFNN